MTPPRFLVSPETLTGTQALLAGPELRHLRVRRLRIGSDLILSDGRGHQRHGVVVALDRHHAVISLSPNQLPERESPLHLVLAQASLKADKMDLVVEKATELGASELLVFTSERSLGHPSVDRQERWQRIARSAAKQCQRSTVPPIGAPICFDDLLSRREVLRLLFWEGHPARSVASAERHPGAHEVLMVIGPEGGFSTAEAERAAAAGFQLLSLGPRVLRAETAALAAVTLCQFLWGDLSRSER
ncbi:MAG TPA: 16S rRNA (uracil(1498)-N(3))-methyltransferase [Candidatus Binatia bacterium]